LLLEEPGGRDINAGAGVLDQQHAEAGLAQVAGGEETADVRRDAADDDSRQSARLVQGGEAWVLRGHRVGIGVSIETLPPDRVESLRVQPRQKFSAGRSHDTVRRIEIVAAAEKAAMVRRVPILAGIDASPRLSQQTIDRRDTLNTPRHRQLIGTQDREATL